MRTQIRAVVLLSALVSPALGTADDDEIPRDVDYLSFAHGAVPVAVGGAAERLKVDFGEALEAIDGDPRAYGATPKPGGPESEIFFVYALPAPTTFREFAVPNVLETPSPSQTFFRNVEIAGSDGSADGPFSSLAAAELTTHAAKGQTTRIPATSERPVTWVKVTLRGGIDVQRDKTFFEFSEIVGHGVQEPVPLLDAFTGKWKGRGVLIELAQEGAAVTGCYDKTGDLTGTVTGNILRATGRTRGGDIPTTFVLTVTDGDDLTGVASTNGAPFRLYTGARSPNAVTGCSKPDKPALGCGSIVHGINFDYDSAAIRPESEAVLDALYAGLRDASETSITIVGHTSSEGAAVYNQKLSERRAQSVADALTARGIAAARLSAQGLGEQHPIADNTSAAGRSLNRRVEIVCR
jgi:outer membrane protein OmpA-like peptidoglycan-associated protein